MPLERGWWSCALAGAHDHRERLRCGAPAGLLEAGLLAGLRDLCGADLRNLGVPVIEHNLHVFGIDDGRGLRDEWCAVGSLVRDGRLLAVEELHGQINGRLRLQLERLVDRSDLLAEKDVLQSRRAGILTADRNLLAVLVQHRDHSWPR